MGTESKLLSQGFCACEVLLGWSGKFARVVGREQDVFKGSRARQEMKLLKDKSNPSIAEQSELRLVELGGFSASKLDLAGGGLEHKAQKVKKSRFSRAGRPLNGEKITRLNLEIEILKYVYLSTPHLIGEAEVFDGDQGF